MSKLLSILILILGSIQCLEHLLTMGYHSSLLLYYFVVCGTSMLVYDLGANPNK